MDMEWTTRTIGVWSVECGGTIIGLGATTKKWMLGVNRIHVLYRFYELSWEWESKALFLSLPLSNQNNSKQEAAAPVGECQEDAKKMQQIIDLESTLNK